MYFVYALLDNRYKEEHKNDYKNLEYRPFYIGKGLYESKSKFRPKYHYDSVINKSSAELKRNPYKYNKIKKLLELGYEPLYVIMFETEDENEAFSVETKLIDFYGRGKYGGILTNIASGGTGGDIFSHLDDSKKENIRKLFSEKWSGKNNPNYDSKLNLKDLYKDKDHWNKGRIHVLSPERKEAISQKNKNQSRYVNIHDPLTMEVIEVLRSDFAKEKYKISNSSFYTSIKRGSVTSNVRLSYVGTDLILSKSKMDNYVIPKRKYKEINIFFKSDINSDEIFFRTYKEASDHTGISIESIRLKCKNGNNTLNNIFRYESDFEYKFNIKSKESAHKKAIIRIDSNLEEKIYDSVSSAALDNLANPATIVACCKNKRKSHRGFKWKYYDKDK